VVFAGGLEGHVVVDLETEVQDPDEAVVRGARDFRVVVAVAHDAEVVEPIPQGIACGGEASEAEGCGHGCDCCLIVHNYLPFLCGEKLLKVYLNFGFFLISLG